MLLATVGSASLLCATPAQAEAPNDPVEACLDDPFLGDRINFDLIGLAKGWYEYETRKTIPVYRTIVTRDCERDGGPWKVRIWTWCATGECEWVPLGAGMADDGWLWAIHGYGGATAMTMYKIELLQPRSFYAVMAIDDSPADGTFDHGADGRLLFPPPNANLPPVSPD